GTSERAGNDWPRDALRRDLVGESVGCLTARPAEHQLGRGAVHGIGANRALERVEIRRVTDAFELAPRADEALGNSEALRLVPVTRLLQELLERPDVPSPERDVAFLLH